MEGTMKETTICKEGMNKKNIAETTRWKDAVFPYILNVKLKTLDSIKRLEASIEDPKFV